MISISGLAHAASAPQAPGQIRPSPRALAPIAAGNTPATVGGLAGLASLGQRPAGAISEDAFVVQHPRTECGAPYRRAPIKQSLKRCTLSWPSWLRPSVASGCSLPTNARHSFSNDDLCAAYEGAANAMRENTSRMVLISNLQGVSALVMSGSEAFMPRIGIG